MSNSNANRFHQFLQLNILLGITIFAIMTYFIVTGEYASLAERKTMEGLFNFFAVGGLVYSALIWVIDYFSYPVLIRQKG